jgi:2-dehydropantoate 2-reductase
MSAPHTSPGLPERVAVVGAGALGLALASALHAAGVEVHLVTRAGSRRDAALARGFGRTGLFGDVLVPAEAVRVTESIDELAAIDPDFTLVCTKTTATAQVAPALGEALKQAPRATPVVVCQNGWGSAECIAGHLDPARVFSGRIITGFRLTGPARVDVTVHAAPIHLGSLFDADPRRLAPLAAAIDRGGIPCNVTRDVRADLLAKLLYNGLLNPLGALVGAPYGVLGERPTTRAIMIALAHEIFAVFEAAGLATHWPDAPSYLETFFADLLPPTAEHESSMLQDLRAGRRTEIDAICGAVCELGMTHGVATPIDAALVTLVHAAETSREQPGARATRRESA